MTVAVLGAGSWGTAMSLVLADAGNEVNLWARRAELAAAINAEHHNPDYLSDLPLPHAVSATADIDGALTGADTVVFATPAQTFRANLVDWATRLPPEATLVSVIKGVELGTLDRMSQVIAEETGAGPERIAVLSGPNLAREIARREPAASVIACEVEATALALQEQFHSPSFRPYTSTDVVGCEIGGAYKNVIAIAVGLTVGLGYGDNATATVITRGLAEIARLATSLGANPLTLMGLAGVGDLVATCHSPLSRNRTFGVQLGQGLSPEQIQLGGHQVAEGVRSAHSICDLAERQGVETPFAHAVDAVIQGQIDPHDLLGALLARDTKAETA